MSVTVTVRASPGPVLVTDTVYDAVSPATTVGLATDLSTPTSTIRWTAVGSVVLLLVGSGSLLGFETTLALLLNGLVALAATLTVISTTVEAPLAKSPITISKSPLPLGVSVTVPFPVTKLALTKVTSSGRLSVARTSGAASGPLFVTVMR